MADRLAQVSGHITNTYGRGLLAGEVAIITGEHCLEGFTVHFAALGLQVKTNSVSSQVPVRYDLWL